MCQSETGAQDGGGCLEAAPERDHSRLHLPWLWTDRQDQLRSDVPARTQPIRAAQTAPETEILSLHYFTCWSAGFVGRAVAPRLRFHPSRY